MAEDYTEHGCMTEALSRAVENIHEQGGGRLTFQRGLDVEVNVDDPLVLSKLSAFQQVNRYLSGYIAALDRVINQQN